MNKKIIILLVIGVVIIVFGWLGYEKYTTTTTTKLYPGKITIGTETWPGYILLYVAQDKGYFKDAGLNVTISLYKGLGDLSRDYVTDKMQGRANLTLDAVSENLKGLDHKAVLVIDYSNGSDAIVASDKIKSVKDFKGKKVAYEPGTLEEFFVAWVLKENGLSLSDIIPVAGDPEKTAKLLEAGEVDVAVSHEPFLSQIIKSHTIHSVYSSADAPGLITDILTFRTDFVKEYPETISAIIDAYFRALDFWKTNPNEADVILAKYFSDTPENIAKQMEGITMLDRIDNRTAFTFAAGFQSLYGNMRSIGEFVSEHQQIDATKKPDTDNLIEPRFIREILK